MASLYEAGWRQGSIVEVELSMNVVVLNASGLPRPSAISHSSWVLATQDCDLDNAETNDPEPGIELRPLFTHDRPADWGIRSAKLRLTEDEYAQANAPRLTVAPNVLTAVLASGAVRRNIPPERRQGFTTWLGLRYDRPAVPSNLVPLAQRISREVGRNRHRELGARVRDVLMQFDDSSEPVRFSLFAVLDGPNDEAEVRAWLASVAAAVPTDLGVADQIEAATADGIAFSTIESSYAADVSQVTWRRGQPYPEGAF